MSDLLLYCGLVLILTGSFWFYATSKAKEKGQIHWSSQNG